MRAKSCLKLHSRVSCWGYCSCDKSGPASSPEHFKSPKRAPQISDAPTYASLVEVCKRKHGRTKGIRFEGGSSCKRYSGCEGALVDYLLLVKNIPHLLFRDPSKVFLPARVITFVDPESVQWAVQNLRDAEVDDRPASPSTPLGGAIKLLAVLAMLSASKMRGGF